MKTRKLTIPYIIWMLVFTMIPIVMIGITAFTDKSGNFSLANFQSAFHYSGVFTKSLLIALISTAICLVVAYPLAYMMTRMKKSTQNTVIMLIMIPMWMNFLLRIYAWVILLQKNGPIDSALSMLGIHGTYIGNTAAVIAGMVYEYLPFMVLPIYTVMSKIDNGLIEAAQDLGSNNAAVFGKVVFPLSIPGIISGITMVFVPSASTFLVDILDRPEHRLGDFAGDDGIHLHIPRYYESVWRRGGDCMTKKKGGVFTKFYIALILIFLYSPIAVMIITSFNKGKTVVWKGFSLKWYGELFKDKAILGALVNTLTIALLASFFATILGTMAAIGINNFRGKKRAVIQNVSNIPIISPDIVMGVSLMLLFAFLGNIFNFEMGYVTVLISHICFCVPFVVLNVIPRLRRMDQSIYDAALDLGCNQFQAFFKVVIHELMPGIISGFLMSFTYSLDDFIITHFTQGAKFQNLSTEIYAMLRRKIPPTINALSTLLFVTIIIIMIIINVRDRREEKRNSGR